MANNEELLKSQLEEQKRKGDGDRRLAEDEFLRKHQEEKRLGKDVGVLPVQSRTNSLSSQGESYSEADRKKRGRERREDSLGLLKKKKTDQEENEEEIEFGQDPIKNLDLGLDLLVQWQNQQTIQKIVTKLQQKKLESIIKKMREEVLRGRQERIRLETMVQERSALAEVVRSTLKEVGLGQKMGECQLCLSTRKNGSPDRAEGLGSERSSAAGTHAGDC